MASDGSYTEARVARKVLLVDDSAPVRDSLLPALKAWGYEARAAGSIAEARATLVEWHPDLVLLDVLLPDGSAVELASELGRMSPAPAVIAITGNATRTEAFDLATHGVRHLIDKPFRQAALERVIREVLAEPKPIEPLVRQAVPSVPLRKLIRDVRNAAVDQALALSDGNFSEAARMLAMSRQGLQRRVKEMKTQQRGQSEGRRAVIGDDDESVRRLLKRWLEPLGFDVVEATNGSEFHRLALSGDDPPPDLLVVDHHMPLMTGVEALLSLRAQGCLSPAILISGGAPFDAVRITAPSVSLPKPVRSESFRRAVMELVPSIEDED